MKHCPVSKPPFFYEEISKEVEAEDPTQKLHLGKMLLKAMRKHCKDATIQVDCALDQEETMGSLLERSIVLAQALRNVGLKAGDIVSVMGWNTVDSSITLIACLFNGIAFNGIDTLLNLNEMASLLRTSRPTLVFCETSNIDYLEEIAKELNCKIVTFKKAENSKYPSLQEFMEGYRGDEKPEEYECPKIDTASTSAFICCTSGSTGAPKCADLRHSSITPMLSMMWASPDPTIDLSVRFRGFLSIAPIYWYTSNMIHIITVFYCIARYQSSKPFSPKHVADIVNKYRPTIIAMPPSIAKLLLEQTEMDWTCLHWVLLAGCDLPAGLANNIDNEIGRTAVVNIYGLTETCGKAFYLGDPNVPGSLGIPIPYMQAKIMASNGKEVGDNIPGELWIKGPFLAKGYYNDPVNTKEAFTEDGWFKTGDLVVRDSNKHYFYLDRLKCMMNTVADNLMYHISPVEIENVIKKLHGVKDVSVTGIRRDDIDLPIAVVVKNNRSNITAQNIVEHVSKNLFKSKHLTGGVMFVDAIPLLRGGKINQLKVRQMATEYYTNTVEKKSEQMIRAAIA